MKIQQIFSTYDLFATLKNKFCIHDVYPLRQNFRNKTSKPLFVLGLTEAPLCSFSENSRFSTKKCQKHSIFFNLRQFEHRGFSSPKNLIFQKKYYLKPDFSEEVSNAFFEVDFSVWFFTCKRVF